MGVNEIDRVCYDVQEDNKKRLNLSLGKLITHLESVHSDLDQIVDQRTRGSQRKGRREEKHVAELKMTCD